MPKLASQIQGDENVVTIASDQTIKLTNPDNTTTEFTVRGGSIPVMLPDGKTFFKIPSICVPVTSSVDISGSDASTTRAGVIQEVCLTPPANAAAASGVSTELDCYLADTTDPM